MFVVRMAGRELRASWRRLVFFFVCVAVGVGAIVALRSLIQSVGATMMAETRALTAADILIASRQPWSDEVLAIIDATLASEPELARTSSIETLPAHFLLLPVGWRLLTSLRSPRTRTTARESSSAASNSLTKSSTRSRRSSIFMITAT